MQEVWKDIPNYEGLYQVSNLGNVKGLDRIVEHKTSNSLTVKGVILTPSKGNSKYLKITLNKNGIKKTYRVHQLVAIVFLNHKPNGFKLVINHINNNPLDNNVNNLEIITNRENTNQKHLKSSSKYTGVSWSKKSKKWKSQIRINNKSKYLGCFINEYDAHLAYQNELNLIINNNNN